MVTRREFLKGGALLGCSAAAHPWLTPVALAAAPWDARLVVIILRGGMDGLDVVQPYGDPDLADLRAEALPFGEAAGATDLDGFFALHPALEPLVPLWKAGELGFAHAVSTPYRDRRSHFDGQDLLEAGAGFGPGEGLSRDGWLNRMLQVVPGVQAETAYAIGRENPLVLKGSAEVSNWVPGTRMRLSPQAERLLEAVYHDDPLFRDATDEALILTRELAAAAENPIADADMMAMQTMMESGAKGAGKGHLRMARFAVERLRGDTRIAAFSINGWDTHNRQSSVLPKALAHLSDTIIALKLGLGPAWEKTTVLAMTEFGRTVRQNGTMGTDHGTGGLMLLAGGAVRGKKVYGGWPGLSESNLYAGRDLLPTEDVRAYAASALRGLFGLDRTTLETAIFPGMDMGQVPRVIL